MVVHLEFNDTQLQFWPINLYFWPRKYNSASELSQGGGLLAPSLYGCPDHFQNLVGYIGLAVICITDLAQDTSID